MPIVRKIAIQLAEVGSITIEQKGKVISPPSSFKGPIRLRINDSSKKMIEDDNHDHEIPRNTSVIQETKKKRKRGSV